MEDARIWIDPMTDKKYAVCGSLKVEIDQTVYDVMMDVINADLNRMREDRLDEIRKLRANYRNQVLQLKDENAKLQEHINYMHLMRVIDQNENDALQELVRQMHTCLTRPKAYAGASQPYLIATECPYFTQGVCDYNACGFERRMRELGVEVD